MKTNSLGLLACCAVLSAGCTDENPSAKATAAAPAALHWCGAWNSTQQYDANCTVRAGDAVYVATAANLGADPPAGGVWDLFTRDGAAGTTGAAGAPGAKGEPGTCQYIDLVVVSQNNKSLGHGTPGSLVAHDPVLDVDRNYGGYFRIQFDTPDCGNSKPGKTYVRDDLHNIFPALRGYQFQGADHHWYAIVGEWGAFTSASMYTENQVGCYLGGNGSVYYGYEVLDTGGQTPGYDQLDLKTMIVTK